MENWIKKVLKLGIKPGSMNNVRIQHDDWCDRLNGIGECNCDPDITLYESPTPEHWAATYVMLKSDPKTTQ